MKLFGLLAIALVLASGLETVPAGTPAPDPVLLGLTHTNAFAVFRYDWRDERRSRDVPVTIYLPKAGPGVPEPLPLIIFSHGLGGSRDGYDYLGKYWAAHGLVSVHLQHLGTDTGVWLDSLDGGPMAAMRRAVANVQNLINRPLDASFAITRMLELNHEAASPFFQRLNPECIGMAGHSLGAFTTLAMAGQTFAPVNGKTWFFRDPRVKAAIPMSASVPAERQHLDETYGEIRIPCLHMTGTLDDSPLGETMARERRVPFDHSQHSDQYLVTFNGADHMTFAGLRSSQLAGPYDREFQRWICISSTVFWNAYLRGDARNRAWLAKNFQTELGGEGKVEVKQSSNTQFPSAKN